MKIKYTKKNSTTSNSNNSNNSNNSSNSNNSNNSNNSSNSNNSNNSRNTKYKEKTVKKNKFIPNINLFKKYEESIKISQYIENLYKFIKSINICFLSGSFAIEDKNQRLWRLLRFTDKKNVSKFIGFTHNLFKKRGHQYDRYILNIDDIIKRRDNPKHKDDKCKCLSQFPKQYQMVCINCNKKTPEGEFIRQCKGIIKFYKFKYKGVVHVFLKLERWRTIKSDEIIKHWKEYKEKKEFKKKDIKRALGNERAEDCGDKCENLYVNDYLDNKGNPLKICIDRPTKNKKTKKKNFYDMIKFFDKKTKQQANGCYTVNEWEYRKGDEVYIPNFINEALLDNIIPYVKK
jgi:hypothetical protein